MVGCCISSRARRHWAAPAIGRAAMTGAPSVVAHAAAVHASTVLWDGKTTRGQTTKPIERPHAPVKVRLRTMRGLRSIATGQRVLDAVEAAQALRRGALLRTPRCSGPQAHRTTDGPW
jgi:hypothetical protein